MATIDGSANVRPDCVFEFSTMITPGQWSQRFSRTAPGFSELLAYKRADLPSDIIAGLSVAAVALPVGVAYGQLAGFSPEVGLYASILPSGCVRIVRNVPAVDHWPDAATCALVAAAVGPWRRGTTTVCLALDDTCLPCRHVLYYCPVPQIGRACGFPLQTDPGWVSERNGVQHHARSNWEDLRFSIVRDGIVPRLVEFASKLGLTHLPTLGIGLSAFVV